MAPSVFMKLVLALIAGGATADNIDHLIQQQVYLHQCLARNLNDTAWSRIECHIRLDLRTGKDYCSGATHLRQRRVCAHTSRHGELKMGAPYWQMGRPFLHPSQPSVYCVEADPVSMCKLASGHFSLKVCPFRYFSQPLGTQASTTTLRRKGRALRDVVESLEGTATLAVQLAHQLLEIERIPASLPDVWDGMTFAFRTADSEEAEALFGETGVVTGFARGLFFVLKELAWHDVGEWTPELLYQLHSVVCPQLGARTEHMGHGEDTVPPLGIEVPALVDSFLQWLRRLHHKRCADRVVVALQAGLFLGWIHPWRDCNGRTARLVTSALLIQEGVVPAFFSLGRGEAALEAHVFAQNKSYYGDASTYIDGMLNQLNLSAEVFQTFVLKANPRAIAKMKPPPPTWAGAFGRTSRPDPDV